MTTDTNWREDAACLDADPDERRALRRAVARHRNRARSKAVHE